MDTCSGVYMAENNENTKNVKKCLFLHVKWGSQKAHLEKRWKLFVGQQLRLAPKCWLKPKSHCSWRIGFFNRFQTSLIWESLPISDQQTLFLIIYISFMWASYGHDEKGTFVKIFEGFSSMQPWKHMLEAGIHRLKYTTASAPFLTQLNI